MSDRKLERVGVYVCHCGSNIAGTVDVVELAKWAGEKLKHQRVVVSPEYKFMGSSLGKACLGEKKKIEGVCPPGSLSIGYHEARRSEDHHSMGASFFIE